MAKVYKDYSKQVLKGIDAKISMALTEIGMSVTTEAMARTPVDTGNLRANNKYKTSTGKGSLAIGQPDGHSVLVGNMAEYAIPIHFGTAKLAGRPWLWNAIVFKATAIMNILRKRLQ